MQSAKWYISRYFCIFHTIFENRLCLFRVIMAKILQTFLLSYHFQVVTRESQNLVFTIHIFELLPKHYYFKAVSDRWLGSETVEPISFQHLLLPEKHPPHTGKQCYSVKKVVGVRDCCAYLFLASDSSRVTCTHHIQISQDCVKMVVRDRDCFIHVVISL